MEPDASVIIPTYNRKDDLPKAIASCFEGNDDLDVEVVVVDDGSTDGTQEWGKALRDERIKYVRQKNEGAQVARNRGMNKAAGEFIKFLDDDDQLLPGALSEEIDQLEREGAALSCGHLHVRGPNENRVFSQKPAPDIASGIFRGCVWTHPHTLLYRREALRGCRWDPAIPYHQDTAFAIEASTQALPETIVDRPVALYNNHEGTSISNDTKSTASPVERAILQIELIERGVDRLRAKDRLESHHLRAATAGMWQWAHIISGYDLSEFEAAYEKIEATLSSFRPRRQSPFLDACDSMFGARGTEYLTHPFRRVSRHFEDRTSR
jgi:glycosyltransferase involved in cell wall biosynthesis